MSVRTERREADRRAGAGPNVRGCLGTFAVSALAVLAIVGIAAFLLLKSCADGLQDLKFGLGPQTGQQWCHNQRSARPFLGLVNKALIGGTSFPTQQASTFWEGSNLFTGPPPTIAADTKTLSDALQPGVPGGATGSSYRIPSSSAFAVKAAALRLDRFCADFPP